MTDHYLRPEKSELEKRIYDWIENNPNRTAEDVANEMYPQNTYRAVHRAILNLYIEGWILYDDVTSALRVRE